VAERLRGWSRFRWVLQLRLFGQRGATTSPFLQRATGNSARFASMNENLIEVKKAAAFFRISHSCGRISFSLRRRASSKVTSS
jgi:hypothetical protein